MRLAVSSLIVLCLTAGSITHAQAPKPDAASVLAAAREALGGEKKLAGVKNFVATGRTRQVSGINLVPIEFELYCELPDKFVRVDEIPAKESGPTSSGFVGDTLVQLPAPPEMPAAAMAAAAAAAAGRTPPAGAAPGAGAPPTSGAATPPAGGAATGAGAPPPAAGAKPPQGVQATAPGAPPAPGAAAVAGAAVPPGAAAPPGAPGQSGAAGPGGPAARVDPRLMRVMMAKQEFAKLMLGLFAASPQAYPLTFSWGGVAEAPQGKADIIEVKGAANFALKLFINDETHLPIMVTWTTPTTNVILDVPGVPKPETIPPGSLIVDAPAPPPSTASKEEMAAYAKTLQDLRKNALAGAKPTENRLYFADYRDIGNGIKFPFRLRKAVAGETIEETNFDGFKTNTKIDPRKFPAVK